MAFSRVLTVLRRAVYFTDNFGKYHVTRDFRVHRSQAFNHKKSIVENDDTTGKKQRPKTVPVPKITLLLPDDSITVTVLEEAQRLAKRRKLNLVKITDFDSKTQRASYKLTTNTNLLEESEEQDTSKDTPKSRGTKLLYISSKISDHDLQIKTKHLLKLLNKGNKVKVVINLDNAVEDKVHKNIEEAVKNYGDIQRMPSKKNVVLLLINSLLNSKNEDSLVKNNEEN